jgi:hypothetical protein
MKGLSVDECEAKDILYEISQTETTQNYWSDTLIYTNENTHSSINPNGCTSQQRRLQRKRHVKRMQTEVSNLYSDDPQTQSP